MKRTVIVVDDEVGSPAFSFFQHAVTRDGFNRYTFIWCTNCKAALQEIQECRPYAILLDLNFPPEEMQGREMLAQISKTDPSRSIPILVFTSVDNVNTAVDTMKQGAFDYIPKAKGAVALTATEVDLLAIRLNQLDNSFYYPYSKRIATWYNVNATRYRGIYSEHLSERSQRKKTIPKKQIEAGLIDTHKRVFDSHLVSGSRSYNPALVGSIPELFLHTIGVSKWQRDLTLMPTNRK
jgi:CheY-like chemotaxis protein